MNLFRSEEHLTRWLRYSHAGDDYVMSVADWAKVFSASAFRRRLEPDYLAHAPEYLEDYRRALLATGKTLPAPDRVLSTVMFTDIVDSTRLAAHIGDAEWRALLKRHNDITRSQLEHFGEREIDQTGDGFLSTFDSPTRAILCATAISQAVANIGLQVRAGVRLGRMRGHRRPSRRHRRPHRSPDRRTRWARTRCSSRRPSRTQRPVQASPSPSEAPTSSKVFRGSGSCMPSCPERPWVSPGSAGGGVRFPRGGKTACKEDVSSCRLPRQA